jgi:hypothetical protein
MASATQAAVREKATMKSAVGRREMCRRMPGGAAD